MFFKSPQRAALLSIISNLTLTSGKAGVAVMSGSTAILSEALHSSLDLLASLMAWIALKFSASPPDREHPYGHGKFENLSGFLEGLLIFAVAVGIFYQAGQRLFHPVPVRFLYTAMGMMGLSAGLNLLVATYLYKAARRFDSVALEADAAHLLTDVYTSVGVLIGLVGYYLSGHHLFDTIPALLVGLVILYTAARITWKSLSGLIDTRLPETEEHKIRELVRSFSPILELTKLKSRKSGPVRHLDLVLLICGRESLTKIHTLCDDIEAQIKAQFPGALVHIHPEPCLKGENRCLSETCTCPFRLDITLPASEPTPPSPRQDNNR
ncbi:MAG: cation diffusion facilitator family transporter [Desulfobacca sp.]|nr:cation diffusion facilitator family transporter [Desulfobacca sp.]